MNNQIEEMFVVLNSMLSDKSCVCDIRHESREIYTMILEKIWRLSGFRSYGEFSEHFFYVAGIVNKYVSGGSFDTLCASPKEFLRTLRFAVDSREAIVEIEKKRDQIMKELFEKLSK